MPVRNGGMFLYGYIPATENPVAGLVRFASLPGAFGLGPVSKRHGSEPILAAQASG